MTCFPNKSMGVRFKFASVSVSSSWKTDFGFACPIERVFNKSERPLVVLLQKLKFNIFYIRPTTLIMKLWSHGLKSSNDNFAVVEHNDIRVSSFLDKTTNDN